MLDAFMRPIIDPPLSRIARAMVSLGIRANVITLIGFVCGLVAMTFIAFGAYFLGGIAFCVNRLLDGLDGAVARHMGPTDRGGFLDIVCDFIIYAGIVFAFSIGNNAYAFYASFLIFSFVGPITSFLAYAIIAAKKNIITEKRGKKSFYHLGGLCEGTETTMILLLMCFFPNFFKEFCLIYGVLCWMTTVGRVYRAFSDFDETVCTKWAQETKDQDPSALSKSSAIQ